MLTIVAAMTESWTGLRAGLMASAAIVVMAAPADATCTLVDETLVCSTDTGATDYDVIGGAGLNSVLLDSSFASLGVFQVRDLTGSFVNDGTIDGRVGLSAPVMHVGSTGAHTMTAWINNGTIFDYHRTSILFESGVTLGRFENHGTIEIRPFTGETAVSVQGGITGDVINTGTILASGYGISVHGDIGGDFINSGTITTPRYYLDGASVYLFGDVAGDVINTGTLSGVRAGLVVEGDIGGDVRNSGVIETTLVTPGSVGLALRGNVDGDVVNSGRITSTRAGLEIAGLVGGDVVNSGVISGPESSLYLSGTIGGHLINSGTLSSVLLGLRMDGTLVGDFRNTGTIEAVLTGAVFAGQTGGSVINDGTISGDRLGLHLTSDIGGDFVNNGSILSDVLGLHLDGAIAGDFINHGLISGGSAGSILLGGEIGAFLNTGVIHGIYQNGVVSGSWVNEGSIVSTNPGGYSVLALSGFAGDFINSGYIGGIGDDLPAYGVLVLDPVAGNVENSGVISGIEGGFVSYDEIGGTFTNSGSLTSDVAALTIGVLGDVHNTETGVIDGVTTGLILIGMQGASFVNDGIIRGGSDALSIIAENAGFHAYNNGLLESDGYGFFLLGGSSLIGTVYVTNTGTIFGGEYGFISQRSHNLRIENTGTISGGLIDSVGAWLDGNFTYLVNEVGAVIEGTVGISGGDGHEQVFNSGRITGFEGTAISFGGGDDLLQLDAGSVIEGAVLGGEGNDAFLVNSVQTLDFEISDFEHLTVYNSASSAGDSLAILGRDQIFSISAMSWSRFDLAGHTLTTPWFFNEGRLFGNGGSIDGDLYNYEDVDGQALSVTGDVYNLRLISPGGDSEISTLTIGGDLFNLRRGDAYVAPDFLAPGGPPVARVVGQTAVLVFSVDGLDHDQISVAGEAVLDGFIVVLGDLSDLRRARAPITLIDAAGGVSGTPIFVNQGGLLFTPELALEANALTLSFDISDFGTSLATTGQNQIQAARGLQGRWNAGASAVDDVILALDAGADAGPVLTAYTPETSAALTRHGARQARELGASVASCAFGLSGGGCGDRVDAGAITLWTQFSATSSTIAGDGNAAEVEEDFTQLAQGAERRFGDNVTAGLFLASASGTAEVDQAARGQGRLESVSGGVYARLSSGRYSLAGLAGISDGDVSVARNTPMGVSRGEGGSSASFARIDARATFLTGETRAGANVSYTYTYAELDDFSQRGGGAFDLEIQGDSFSDREVIATFFLDHQFPVGSSGHVIGFGGNVGLIRSLGERSASVLARLPGSPTAFEALGPETGGNGTLASGYLSLENPDLRVGLRLGIEARDLGGETSSRGFGRLSWTF